MCGISAVRRFDGTPVEVEDLRRMAGTLLHRGPDDAGYALLDKNSLGLATVRLSIIDPERGGQPIFHLAGETCILLNGEIYDHQSLRKELVKQGHEPQTATDTEVALLLYHQYGLSFLDHLNGEYALVIWDAPRRRLLMARDRCGIKPLFYRVTEKELVIASEVKAIFALPQVPRRISPRYMTSVFLGITTGSESAFEGIRSLAPGHYLIADESGVHEETPYWQPRFDVDRTMSFEDAGAEVRKRLLRAVGRRVVADHPVNACISGGVDSTLVLGCMVRHGVRPKAYHIAFPGSEYDESGPARSVAEYYGAHYDSIDCTMERMAEALVDSVYHVEGVLVGLNVCAKLLLSRHAQSEMTKVCLTGEGSDEIFAGYPHFRLEAIWRHLGRESGNGVQSRELVAEFRKSQALTRGIMWHDLDPSKVAPIYGYPCLLHTRVEKISRIVPWMLQDEILKRTLSPSAMLRRIFEPEEYRRLHPVNAARKMALHYLAGHIIPGLGDRVEMAGSIECRLPFLDHELVDFSCTIPPEHLVDAQEPRVKRLLLDSFADLLPPAEIWQRSKQCFLAPSWRGLTTTRLGRDLLGEFLSHRAVRQAGLFRNGFVRSLDAMWRLGVPYASKRLDQLLGAILTMQILHGLFVERPMPVSPDFAMTERISRKAATASRARE